MCLPTACPTWRCWLDSPHAGAPCEGKTVHTFKFKLQFSAIDHDQGSEFAGEVPFAFALHCLHCLHFEQGSSHEVSARLPHVQGTGRSNTDFAVHLFMLCADSDQFNSLSRSSDTCVDMSWTDKAPFLRHRSCVNQLLHRACPCRSCLLLFPPLSFQPSLSLARWLDTSSMT